GVRGARGAERNQAGGRDRTKRDRDHAGSVSPSVAAYDDRSGLTPANGAGDLVNPRPVPGTLNGHTHFAGDALQIRCCSSRGLSSWLWVRSWSWTWSSPATTPS